MIPFKDPKSSTTELKKTEISKVPDENVWLDEDAREERQQCWEQVSKMYVKISNVAGKDNTQVRL